jgi:hypothetical protein
VLKVKKEWSYAFTPPYIFIVWCLIKHRNNLTFTFTGSTKPVAMKTECLPASGTVWESDLGGWGAVENM